MSAKNVDAIQGLSNENTSLEIVSKTSSQSVNELCMERERNSTSSTSFRRNSVLTNHLSADRVQNNENTKRGENITYQKRKQLVRQKAATEHQLDSYRITSLEHKDDYISETGTSSKATSHFSNQEIRIASKIKNKKMPSGEGSIVLSNINQEQN